MVMDRLKRSQWEDELSEQSYQEARAVPASSAVQQRFIRSAHLSLCEPSGVPHLEQQRAQVVVMQLQSFEQVTQAIQILWQGQALVLNLTQLDVEIAQRAVDFVAGATCSIDGQQQYLAPRLFLFAPKDVELANAVDETACL